MHYFDMKPGEEIVIGEGVVLVYTEQSEGRVRLGIEADRSVPVWREELWREIQRERRDETADRERHRTKNGPGSA